MIIYSNQVNKLVSKSSKLTFQNLMLYLQNGQIFMFTGMLKLLHNDNTLATVLGHEISHAILQHGVSVNLK